MRGRDVFQARKNNPEPGGRLALINSAPSSSMLKINLAPTGVWQKNNSTSKVLMGAFGSWKVKSKNFIISTFLKHYCHTITVMYSIVNCSIMSLLNLAETMSKPSVSHRISCMIVEKSWNFQKRKNAQYF